MAPLSNRLGVRHDSFSVALLASLMAHALLLSLWGTARELGVLAAPKNLPPQPAEEEKRLQFELVETPPDAPQAQPTERTNLVSDKSTRASDLYTASDKPRGEPYSEGLSPYRVFAGGATGQMGGQAASGGQKEELSGAQGRLQRPQEAPSETTPTRDQAGVELHERFSAQVLSGASGRRPGVTGFGSDDVSFRSVDFSAEELGGVTLNTYAWDFAPYVLEMKRKIRQNVYPPPAFTRLGIISGETVLRFRVLPDGQMTDLEVLGYTGHPSLKETSVIAVKNSAPFKPLPKGFPEEYLELTWTFIYSVTRP
ncbi:MAG: energy transducer TonB [candidate division KSB1 bacterium]|nr:energy transducer TonB [candidate division KSB1 bacterium]